jgi:hypothetical protein
MSVGLLALGIVAASCIGCTSDTPERTASPNPTATASRGPSQSAADAKRDGVVPAVAALPFGVRVAPLSTVRLNEQLWVISRLGDTSGTGVDCEGPEEGEYGVDWVCSSEYGELLLLNRRGTKILRALPLPSVPPQHIAVTDDAAYCGRAGDGGLPHSMVCRIDRRTFETTVWVFWDSDHVAQTPEPSLLPGWKLHEEYLPMYKFQADDDAVWAKDFHTGNTWTKLDPVTLEIVDEKVVRPEPRI